MLVALALALWACGQALPDTVHNASVASINLNLNTNFNLNGIRACGQALPENQRRTVPVRGVVTAVRNRGIRTSFTLLNNITGGGNIERTFPLCARHPPCQACSQLACVSGVAK